MSTTPFVGTPSQVERLQSEADVLSALARNISCNLRVALPGVIVSFDEDAQTVEVDLAIQDRLILNGQSQYKQIPRLLDVPVCLPRAGGFTLTMPISKGDECLVIFADMCINAWWQNGAVENGDSGYIGQQHERPRRHSFSDAFAIIGTWSQPNKLSNYSTTAVQLRSDDGNTVVEVGENEITVKATTVSVQAQTATVQGTNQVTVESNEQVTISGNGKTSIEGKDFLTHTHSGVQSGGSISGPVS